MNSWLAGGSAAAAAAAGAARTPERAQSPLKGSVPGSPLTAVVTEQQGKKGNRLSLLSFRRGASTGLGQAPSKKGAVARALGPGVEGAAQAGSLEVHGRPGAIAPVFDESPDGQRRRVNGTHGEGGERPITGQSDYSHGDETSVLSRGRGVGGSVKKRFSFVGLAGQVGKMGKKPSKGSVVEE